MKRLLFLPLDYHLNPNPDFLVGLSEYFVVWGDTKPASNFAYIFMQCGALHPTALRKIKGGAKVIIWTGDARAEAMENVTQYADIADLTLLAVGIGQKEMYSKVMGKVDYLQQGVFDSFFIEPKEVENKTIVFIGNNYDHFTGAVDREQLCMKLAKELPLFETIGNGWDRTYANNRSCPYNQSHLIYNNAYISISHACFNDIEGYYSNRTIDIMASGGCCLQRWFPGIENYFTDGYDCVVYRTNDEALEKVQYLIERPEIRNMIARNGHNTAKQKHTFSVRAREIKELIYKHL